MPDTQQQQQQGTEQQSQPQPQDSGQHRNQSDFDTTFLHQISQQQSFGQQVDWAREYFDSIEAQVRSARRVAEASALMQIQQQIVAQCASLVRQQVLSELRRDPSLTRQSGSTTGSR